MRGGTQRPEVVRALARLNGQRGPGRDELPAPVHIVDDLRFGPHYSHTPWHWNLNAGPVAGQSPFGIIKPAGLGSVVIDTIAKVALNITDSIAIGFCPDALALTLYGAQTFIAPLSRETVTAPTSVNNPKAQGILVSNFTSAAAQMVDIIYRQIQGDTINGPFTVGAGWNLVISASQGTNLIGCVISGRSYDAP